MRHLAWFPFFVPKATALPPELTRSADCRRHIRASYGAEENALVKAAYWQGVDDAKNGESSEENLLAFLRVAKARAR